MHKANIADHNPKRLPIVVSCEHGGNLIPETYQALFPDQALLESHRGYDPGALLMANEFASAFSAPLISANICRLLVDLNRSIGNPSLHSKVILQYPPNVRETIINEYYQPYRQQVALAVHEAIDQAGYVFHLSCHSFTPELNGKVRKADIGLLYDPASTLESKFCQTWQQVLSKQSPDLVVRRNYPYAGKNDCFNRWFRRQLAPTSYIGFELEINQKHILNQDWSSLRSQLIASLAEVMLLMHEDESLTLNRKKQI